MHKDFIEPTVFVDPVRDTTNYLVEENGKYYNFNNELLSITAELEKFSKTGASHYFTMPDNPNKFLCHLEPTKKIFVLAETIEEKLHTVWLKGSCVDFYEGNIVLRDYKTKTSQPFQNKNDMSTLIESEYTGVKNLVKQRKNEINEKIEFKPIQFVLDKIKDFRHKKSEKTITTNKPNA